jgi:hypothetical protein
VFGPARRATLTLLNLLLLLDDGLTAFGRDRRNEIVPLRQSEPRPRHMREGDPRIPVAESGGHLEALLCASPILVCSTRHDPCPSVRHITNIGDGILVQVKIEKTENSKEDPAVERPWRGFCGGAFGGNHS